LLAEYKSLMKQTTRDESLRPRLRQESVRLLRDFERWISEAKVASPGLSDDADVKEAWVLEKLCEALLDKGGIVPVSKKKRVIQPESFLPSNTDIWTPLLLLVQSAHPTFGSVLLSHLVYALAGMPQSTPDKTVDSFLAAWVCWVTSTWKDSSGCSPGAAVTQIMLSLANSSPTFFDVASSIIGRIMHPEDSQKERSLNLLRSLKSSQTQDWTRTDLDTMKQRLSRLQSASDPLKLTLSPSTAPAIQNSNGAPSPSPDVIPGWRLLISEAEWKPCPIGVSGTL